MASAKPKVLIIDDSALIRKLLTNILEDDFEVVGSACDPILARTKIKKLNPDVLTLDVEMPRMDGLTFLRNLMRLRPMPVVMVSSLTEHGADITLEALDIGAVDFVAKPKLDVGTLTEQAAEIVEKVRIAAAARVSTRRPLPKPPERLSADAVLVRKQVTHFGTTDMILAIGASTGGTEAIREVVSAFPADMPGTVITQHIPEAFSASFAKRINDHSRVQVRQAVDGEAILPGHAYIAPGNRHLLVVRSGARYLCRLKDGPPVNRHIPSVDVMFRSVAQSAGKNAIGVILTGMGADGAQGLHEMQEAGAFTVAQDEESSVVWGMPGEAVKIGATDDVVRLDRIARRLVMLVKGRQAA